MTDFTAARINMVDSQIHTMGVVNDAILDAFRTVPRELFVPEGRQAIAYNDEDLAITPLRWLTEPVTHARLLQAAAPTPQDKVLDVACGGGYSTAILSMLTAQVIAVEEQGELLESARACCQSLGYANTEFHQAPAAQGYANEGPYTLICLNGATAEIPQALLDQLAPSGRMVAVVRKPGDKIGRATLFMKSASGAVSDRILFDAAIPYLPGLEPRPSFVF